LDNTIRLLLIENDQSHINRISNIISEKGKHTIDLDVAGTEAKLKTLLNSNSYDAAVLNLDFKNKKDASALAQIRKLSPTTPVILLASPENRDSISDYLKKGADDYLIKDKLSRDLLIRSIEYVRRNKQTTNALKVSEERFKSIVEKSKSCIAIYQAVNEGEDFIFLEFNKSAEEVEGVMREDVLGKSVRKVFPGVVEFGLFDVFRRVWKTGNPEHFPTYLYEDQRITGWRDNFIYKLSTGEIVAVYSDETERKRKEEELRRSERMYRAVVESSIAGITMADTDENIIFANEAYARMLGYTTDELIGKNLSEITDGDEYRKLKDMTRARITGKSDIYEARMKHKNGSDVNLLIQASPIFSENGKYKSTLAIVTDITRRKKTEEKLRKTHYAIENSTNAIFILDTEGVIAYINPTAVKLWGFDSREEMIGTNILDYWSEKSKKQAEEIMGFLREQSTYSGKGTLVAKKKNGDEFYVRVNAAMMKDEERNPIGMTASFVDVTSEIQAEKKLIQSERKYRELYEGSRDGFVLTDLEGKIIEFNTTFKEMLGYSEEELLSKTYNDLTPEKWHTMEDKIIKEQVFGRGFSEAYEKEYIRKDGIVFPIEIRTYLLKNEENKPYAMWAWVRNITERKLSEAVLRESEEKFRTITSSANDGIIMIDNKARIEYWNESAEKMFGYREKEVIGEDVRFLMPEGLHNLFIERLISFRDSDEIDSEDRTREITVKRKNGSEFPVEISFSSVKIGGEWKAIGIIRDVTERKIYEEHIKKALQEKELLLKEIHHRVKNNMQVIVSLLNLEKRRKKKGDTDKWLLDTQNRIKSMEIVHQKLYQTDNFATIDLHDIIRDLVDSVYHAFGAKKELIKLDLDVQHISVDIDKGITVALLINEIISNSLKHAFPEGRKGNIYIKLINNNGDNEIIVGDNGIGFSENIDFENTKSLGLRLIKELSEQLEGEIQLDRSSGTEFKILF